MIKKIFFTLFLFYCSFIAHAQNAKLSVYATVSVITSGPGNELYEKFGHTAIRVKDPLLNLDLIYNYGFIDFNAPNFYLKFTRGYMNYTLARYPFRYALKSAKRDKRWTKEQVLNFTQEENNQVFAFLENNARPENANYFYDPFFDNCATKPREIIKLVLGNNITFPSDSIVQNQSIRQLMNNEINVNTWGSLGINVALGSRLDQKATVEETMFLPDYVFSVLENSTIKRDDQTVPLIKKTTTLLNFKEKENNAVFLNPYLVFTLLLLFSCFITFKNYKNKTRSKWFDFLLFFSTGITGVLIIFLWFFTDHSTAPNNFNFLWAFAPNVIVAFYIRKNNPPKWIIFYIYIVLTLIAVIPLIWLTGIQLYSPCIIPIILILIVRYLYLQKTLNG